MRDTFSMQEYSEAGSFYLLFCRWFTQSSFKPEREVLMVKIFYVLVWLFTVSISSELRMNFNTCCIFSIQERKKSEVTQSCPTLWNPMDCSPPGSSVHGILQATILEWVAVPSSKYNGYSTMKLNVSSDPVHSFHICNVRTLVHMHENICRIIILAAFLILEKNLLLYTGSRMDK